MTNEKKAILFDLDGTLLDTHELILGSFRYAFANVLGEDKIPSDEKITSLIGIPLDDQLKILAPGHASVLAKVYREHNNSTHDSKVKEFASMKTTLASLKEKELRMAVVTSKRRELAQRGLNIFDYSKYFEFLIGAEDSKEHKPNPEPLLIAASRMGLKAEQCVYVGDSPYDMQAACSASMLAIGVLWGMFSKEHLLEAGASRLLKEPKELLTI
jgi:pyrophosphatase PpaX